MYISLKNKDFILFILFIGIATRSNTYNLQIYHSIYICNKKTKYKIMKYCLYAFNRTRVI